MPQRTAQHTQGCHTVVVSDGSRWPGRRIVPTASCSAPSGRLAGHRPGGRRSLPRPPQPSAPPQADEQLASL